MSHQANTHKDDNTMTGGKKALVDNIVFFFLGGREWGKRVVLRDFMLASIFLIIAPTE